jgi:hypothetical protein
VASFGLKKVFIKLQFWGFFCGCDMTDEKIESIDSHKGYVERSAAYDDMFTDHEKIAALEVIKFAICCEQFDFEK